MPAKPYPNSLLCADHTHLKPHLFFQSSARSYITNTGELYRAIDQWRPLISEGHWSVKVYSHKISYRVLVHWWYSHLLCTFSLIVTSLSSWVCSSQDFLPVVWNCWPLVLHKYYGDCSSLGQTTPFQSTLGALYSYPKLINLPVLQFHLSYQHSMMCRVAYHCLPSSSSVLLYHQH